MLKPNMQSLIDMFEAAKEVGAKYFGIVVEIEGAPRCEMIINSIENIDAKLDYYKKAYDENLQLKHAKGIRIKMFWIDDDILLLAHHLEKYM